MRDKLVVKYTKNGVVRENLATKETEQLTVSEYGNQIRYEKENFFYDKYNKQDLTIDEQNLLLNHNAKLSYKEIENKNTSNEIKDNHYNTSSKNTNANLQNKFDKDINYTSTEYIYHKNNKKINKNNKPKNMYHNSDVHNYTNTVLSYKNKNYNYSKFKNSTNKNIDISKNNKTTNKTNKNYSANTSNNKISEHKGDSNILKGIDTAPKIESYSTAPTNTVVNTVGGVKGKVINTVKNTISNTIKRNDDTDDDSSILGLIPVLMSLLLIIIIFPILFIIMPLVGFENYSNSIVDTNNIITSYITTLDNELKTQIQDRVNEDNAIENTQAVIENIDVIGSMTKYISSIVINRYNTIETLTDEHKNTITSIYNQTYEYHISTVLEENITKKTYKVFALSADELYVDLGLTENDVTNINNILLLLNEQNTPDSGETPPLNPSGFSNPMIVGTYTVTQLYNDGHNGVDLGAGEGTPIYASASGVVRFAGFGTAGNGFNRYGYCVFIDHQNGFYTMYAHCNALYVSTGQTVTQGQVIAGVGNTGQSFGNHLHFEIRGGIQFPRYDPSIYINF